MCHTLRFLGPRSYWLIVAFAIVLHSPSANAQVKEEPIDPKFNTFTKGMNNPDAAEVVKVLNGAAPFDGSAAALFSEYFEKQLYPHLTLKANTASWAKNKLEIKRKFFNSAKTPQQEALNLLNEVSLKKMSEYANDNYNIVCRYNAMLFIGEQLNQSFPADKKTVPMPEALIELEKAALNGNLPPAVRIAAMIGLKRHAELGVPEDKKKALSDMMLKLVAAKAPAAGISKEGHDWLRRRAAEVCVALGQNTPDVKKIMEENKPLEALPGVMDLPGLPVGPETTPDPTDPAKPDADPSVDPLGVPTK